MPTGDYGTPDGLDRIGKYTEVHLIEIFVYIYILWSVTLSYYVSLPDDANKQVWVTLLSILKS